MALLEHSAQQAANVQFTPTGHSLMGRDCVRRRSTKIWHIMTDKKQTIDVAEFGSFRFEGSSLFRL